MTGPALKTRRATGIHDESGVALILALLFVVLLTALVVEFSYEVQVEATHAANGANQLEAYLAAKSGIHGGLALLAADLYEPPGSQPVQGLPSGREYDGLDEEWAYGLPMGPMNDAIMQTTIEDEYGKINLNALLVDNDREQRNELLIEALEVLFLSREMEESPVDAILDWLDSDDDEQGAIGAESDYYASLEHPYKAKNADFESVEELLLVAGITPEAYFGIPEFEQLPLDEFLTVHGHPEGAINVNTAMPEVMQATIEAAEVQGLMTGGQTALERWLQRMEEGQSYASEQDLRSDGLIEDRTREQNNSPGQNDDAQQKQRTQQPNQTGQPRGGEAPGTEENAGLFTWQGDAFRIRGDGLAGEVQVRIEAFVWRDRELIEPELFRILDWRVIQ